MQNVDIIGKITRLTPIKEYGTDKKGRVMNVFISDGTGTIRLPLWNDEIDKVGDFHEGDVIHFRGYAIEGLSGVELRLGRYGSIAKSDEIIEDVKITRSVERANIEGLSEGQYREIRAPIVQVFESNVFYEVCPECKTRLKFDEKNNELKCNNHGVVNPEYNMVVSGIIDDGTGHIRAVFFNENAEKLIGMQRQEAKKLFDAKKKVGVILERIPMGKDFLFEGRVKKNNFFDRLELMVNNVKEVDVKNEIEMIMKGG
jgi:replication factor A1